MENKKSVFCFKAKLFVPVWSEFDSINQQFYSMYHVSHLTVTVPALKKMDSTPSIWTSNFHRRFVQFKMAHMRLHANASTLNLNHLLKTTIWRHNEQRLHACHPANFFRNLSTNTTPVDLTVETVTGGE